MKTVTAADFHDIVTVSDPRLSPDGSRVGLVRSVSEDDEKYEATIYLVDEAGAGEPMRFTVSEGRDSEPRWSPSGDRLAFVSTRGADDDRPQAWVIPVDGGEARQVTNVAGGVSDLAWSPSGDRLAFVQQVSAADRDEDRDLDVPEDFEPSPPDPRVIDRTVYRSQQRYFDGKRSHVYLADLERDEVSRVTEGDVDFVSPTWGDDATLYYAESVGEDPDDSTAYDIVEHDVENDDSRTIHRTHGWGMTLAATSDGRIAHVYQNPEKLTLRPAEIEVYDPALDDVVRPTADLDRTLDTATGIQWGPDEQTLFFTTPDEGATAVWSVFWDETSPEVVVRKDGSSIADVHVDEETIVFSRSEWHHPGDLFATDRETGEERRLTAVNDTFLEERTIAKPEEVTIESEAETVQGWVLTPPEFDPETTYPLAVEVHGGPHAMWTTSGTMWHEFQTLAARGYVVFWSNPRGSTGYGEEFAAAIERNWGGATMTDVMAGVETVAKREYVDDDNVFLTGGSFGGYMAGWMVGHTDYFRAAVAQRGVFDFTGFYGSTDGAYKLVEGDYGTTPDEEPTFLWEHSPTGHAADVTTPTLVIHSDDDYRTPAATAELFFRQLRKGGVDTRLVRYPDEGHELLRSGQPGHRVDRIERIVRWFDGYSDYEDVQRALDREPNEGLSAGDAEDEN